MKKFSLYLITALTLILLTLPTFLDLYIVQLLIFLFINIMLAQSINLLSGYTGLISIGHAGLFAVGSYTSAVFMIKLTLPFYVTILIAIVMSMFVGWLLSIPAGRVREFYLALMTLGFGLIIEVITKEWSLLGGFSGLSNIPSPVLMNLKILGVTINETAYYYLTFVFLILTTIFLRRTIRSYVGRSMLAIRTNEIAAASVGINAGNVKRLAFILSAGIAGLAGALYAHYIAFLSYEQFTIMKSISILAMAIIGGLGSFIGPFFGAVFETFLPELLQSFEKYQLLIYGVLLVAVVRFFPKGLAGFLKIKESYINISSTNLNKIVSNTFQEDKIQKSREDMGKTENNELLTVKNISKSFGGHQVLEDVSLAVKTGEIYGLIGPNGAGKSTLVNVITGVYKGEQGKILFCDNDITDKSLHENARNGIIRIFQDPRIILEATVLENVLLGAQIDLTNGNTSKLSGLFNKTVEEEWTKVALKAIDTCGLTDYVLVGAGKLPYGTRRLIEIARAMVARPKLLILDEPAAGLSEVERKDLKNLLIELKKQEIGILIIEHDMEFLLSLIDSVTVLDYGKVIYEGDVHLMQKDVKVIEAYLGVV